MRARSFMYRYEVPLLESQWPARLMCSFRCSEQCAQDICEKWNPFSRACVEILFSVLHEGFEPLFLHVVFQQLPLRTTYLSEILNLVSSPFERHDIFISPGRKREREREKKSSLDATRMRSDRFPVRQL